MNSPKNILLAFDWLKKAQDQTHCGGVAAWYTLYSGWGHPYLETTGYIINTFLAGAIYFKDKDLEKRALQMADFLLEWQHPSGGFYSKTDTSSQPVVFDTGQDLIGLADIFNLTKNRKYLDSCLKAADFLCDIQEIDGSWLRYAYGNEKHSYTSRVAWSLLKVWQISHHEKYKLAAIKNLNWTLKQQLPNGWFTHNNFPPPNFPLPYTHNISYAIEGLWYSGLILHEPKYLLSALKPSLFLANYYLAHNFLPSTFDRNWQSQDKYSCLTGDAQLAIVWLEIYEKTKHEKFLTAARRMNAYLKSKQRQGALAGSDPLWGDLLANRGYCRLAYLNWATKFFIDSLLLEEKIMQSYEN